MKRRSKKLLSLFLALLMAVSLLPMAALAAEESVQVTVFDGTATNMYIPVYRYYNYGKTQTIVPASELSSLQGKTITGMSYYPTADSYATLAVYLTETSSDSLTEFVSVPGSAEVFSGNVDFTGNSEAKITFDAPFAYSGGNLLVTVINNTGSYASGLSFYGVSQSDGSRYAYNDGTRYDSTYTGSSNSQGFRPKMTFYSGEPAPVVSYDLWVCGTQVTSANAGDLTVIDGVSAAEGGKASYDAQTNTLALKNASIDGNYYSSDGNVATIAVKSSIKTLNIDFDGTNTIGCENNSSGMRNAVGGLYTSFVFNGTDDAVLNINAQTTPTAENGALRCADLTVNGGTVCCTAPEEQYTGNHYQNNPYGVTLNAASGDLITVNGGKFVCKGWAPVVAGTLEGRVAENTVIKGSVNYDGSELVDYDYSTNGFYNNSSQFQGTYRYVEATPGEPVVPVTSYLLWVGDVQVTSDNLTIDSSDCADVVSGSATYDPDTRTLALDGFVYSGAGSSSYPNAAINYLETGRTLTLDLTGENRVTLNGARGSEQYGIYCDTDSELIIQGGGSLYSKVIYPDFPGTYAYTYGIYGGKVTINGGTVTAEGFEAPNSYGIRGGVSGVEVNGGSLTAIAGQGSNQSFGVDSALAVNGGTVVAKTVSTGSNARALSGAPTLAEGISATASTNADGSGAEKYSADNNGSYKWFKAQSGEPAAITLDIRCSNGASGTVEYKWDTDGSWTAVSVTENTEITLIIPESAATLTVKAAPADEYYINQAQLDDGTGTYTDNAALAAALAEGAVFNVAGDAAIMIEFDNHDGTGGPEQPDIPVSYAYNVETPENENGSVTVKPSPAEAGDTVTVTAEPNEGYEVDKITVTDNFSNEIPVKRNEDGTFSFTMPDGPVKVKAEFKETDHSLICPSKHFSDVDPDAWYHESVDYVVENGLMNGISDELFDPAGTVTRGMVVTILYRLEGEPAVSGPSHFFDVSTEAPEWYTDAVLWACGNGIVEGYIEGPHKVFGPNAPITREQFAAILYRYEQYKGGGFVGDWYFLLEYEDADQISDWADEAMHWCVMKGIIKGCTETTLVPKGEASRAEAAAIIMRYIESGN